MKEEYFVIYDGNGNTTGSVPVDSKAYKENDIVTVMANTGALEKTDSSFSSWNTASDGSGNDYEATGSATFVMGEEDVILYAIWATEDMVKPEVFFSYLNTTVELYSGFIIGTAASENGIAEVQYDTGGGWQAAEGTDQ